MCKSQNLFYSYDFRARGAGRATATSSAANLPTTFPRAHHLPEMQEYPEAAPQPGVMRSALSYAGSAHTPSTAPQSLPVLPGAAWIPAAGDLLVQPQPCPNPAPNHTRQSHWYWYLQEAHRQTDSITLPQPSLDDKVWFSGDHTQTVAGRLNCPLAAVCASRIPAGSRSFSCLHSEASPPGTFPPPAAAMGLQQPRQQQILDSTWGKLPPQGPAGLPPRQARPGTSRQDTCSSPASGFLQQVLLEILLSWGCGAHQEGRLLSVLEGAHGS